MPTRIIMICLLIASSVASGQVTATVAPAEVPIGCEVEITVTNDTPNVEWVSSCPYVVTDVNGGLVYTSTLCWLLFQITPGENLRFVWPQFDVNGQPVTPGLYDVTVALPGGGFSTQRISVGLTNVGLGTLGPLRPGTTRRLLLCSPRDANGTYVCGISAGIATGTSLCSGTFPLDPDPLLVSSLTPGNPNFGAMVGSLNAFGVTDQPSITLPNLPQLSGATLYAAFLIFDPQNPSCPFPRFSTALPLTIQ